MKRITVFGAIIGDIIGSQYEFRNVKRKDFELFNRRSRFTDDSVMTIAVAQALLECNGDYNLLADKTVFWMQQLGKKYPDAGYGGSFFRWLASPNPLPYNSWGNGSAMRVSACGLVASSLDEAEQLAKLTAEVTHNHPEGIKGAQATAAAVYMALSGSPMDSIRNYINEKYYNIDFTLDEIRADYSFDVSCQGSVPQALEAFFESTGYEDAIRNAISIGGDSDTIAAISGAVAGAYYGVPDELIDSVKTYLGNDLTAIVREFDEYAEKNCTVVQNI